METNFTERLETPCIVIDRDKVENNIARMQEAADRAGVDLRPHIKTHKSQGYARMQIRQGAKGITCAKVSEAEVMADGGVDDIFIAYPQVGRFRLERVVRLARRCQRLILGIDSLESGKMLSEAFEGAGMTGEVRLEVDTGACRTGIPYEQAVWLAQAVDRMPGLELTGIYTFKSMIFKGSPTQDIEAAAREEGEMMACLAGELRRSGIAIKDVSAGSTPTGIAVAKTGLVTEIRPGTYIFNDHMLCQEGWAGPEQIAAHYYVTVVSTPRPDYAVIDGGTKTFPMDVLLDQPPYYYPGYGLVDGYPDLCLRRMNEEHGILESKKGNTGLYPGQVLRITPIHICTAINMQNTVYEYHEGKLRGRVIDARGMSV